MNNIPDQAKNSFRIILELPFKQPRIDTVLLAAIRSQDRNPTLKAISRTAYKDLFKQKKILIKGQSTRPSSALAAGTTYVDILGFSDAE